MGEGCKRGSREEMEEDERGREEAAMFLEIFTLCSPSLGPVKTSHWKYVVWILRAAHGVFRCFFCCGGLRICEVLKEKTQKRNT